MAPAGKPPAVVGPPAEAVELVHVLGTSKDRDPCESVGKLHSYGRQMVPLLIGELRVIDPNPAKANTDGWWHAAWCERALRSMTGQRFKFHTRQKLPRDLAEFHVPEEPLGYVVEWMSRARVSLAPRDVQAKVIEAWKAWHASQGKAFRVHPFEAYGEWYW